MVIFLIEMIYTTKTNKIEISSIKLKGIIRNKLGTMQKDLDKLKNLPEDNEQLRNMIGPLEKDIKLLKE